MKALETPGSGEVFAASVLALKSLDAAKLEAVMRITSTSAETRRAFVSALAWVPLDQAKSWVAPMILANRVEHNVFGIGGFALHRCDPGPALINAMRSGHTALRARALRAAGELKRRDALPVLQEYFVDGAAAPRFWAAWSAVLLGSGKALDRLKELASFDPSSDFARRAIQLTLRVLDLRIAREWLKEMALVSQQQRHAVVGCGVSGDPLYMSWLIKQMSVPVHARAAGESFSMITGLDLAGESFDANRPAGFESGPSEDPSDDNVEMDEDENLPWPDPIKAQGWWDQHKGAFTTGVRYLCGKPITIENCQHVLRHGFQRQRTAAALELALLQPNEPLFETRAPGFRQQRLLGLKR
jgi:uncharacterized protein (TIGR02270 family)